MKIALVSYEFPPETPLGGIGTYTSQLALLLSDAGEMVHVFAGSHERSSTTTFEYFVVHRIYCKDPHHFRKAVVDVFSDQHALSPFDIIESAEIHGNAWEIKKRFPNVPLVIRLHAGNYLVESLKKRYHPFLGKLRFLVGALRRRRFDLGFWRRYDFKMDPDYQFTQIADFITAPSEQMKSWAVANWKINPSRITVFGNPFMANSSFKDARTGNEEQVILFYGRLNVLKGMITATRAMKKILTQNPNWIWLIAGEDGFAANGKTSMKEWMKKELADVAGQVRFLGAVSNHEVPTLLQSCSVVIVPSLFESYSYVTLEAMYAGKAVVGSTGTGIASLIDGVRNGLLADPMRPIEWIKELQKLIDNHHLRQNLGIEAANSIENRRSAAKEIVMWYRHIIHELTCHPCE